MWEFFRSLFGTDFMPHFYCLRGEPGVLWLHVVSDVLIAVAYFTIPFLMFDLVRRRRERFFRKVALLFVIFIAACGATHVLAVWTIWVPVYRLEGVVKGVTAVASVATAVVLFRVRPLILRLPSIAELELEIDRKRVAEAEARFKEERFRAFVDSVEDYAIYMLDPEGRILSWNHGAERLKGYTAEEVVGQSFSIFFTHEDRAAKVPEAMLRAAREDRRFDGEGWRVRKDGRRFLANVHLRPIHGGAGELRGYSKVTRDLTGVREAEQKFQMLLEAAPDAMVVVDSEGRIEVANLQVETLFGYPRMDLVGQGIEVLVPATLREEHAHHREAFFATPRKRAMGADLELMAVRRDGSEFPVEISLSPLEGPGGMGVTAAIRDVTERKATAQALAQKVAELRQSNEALEQFAHIASHDLQEPLRMVASYTQLLSRRYKGKLDTDADEFIGYAVDGTQRMKRLIEDLLVYSRAGRGTAALQKVEVAQALQEAICNLRSAIEESGAAITFDALPMVAAGELQLVQLFQNLVGNAIKYRGGRKPKIHVSAKKEQTASGEEWVFSVADNGIGIEPQYYDRVFVIFQRLHGHGEYEGTGIGLAICKRVLQQQGGRIWVESEPGVGSTFHFALPVR
jgi:PAS domain S-box-containing protein